MTPTTSSLQLTLFQAENEANRYIQYTMVEQANALARALAKKNLPMFYFTEAGKELKIPAKTCRSWKINTWPTVNRPGDDKLIHKVAIYIRVYLRLNDYPEDETYSQATNRLQRRILEIKEKDFSHNRISQHLRISFRTLNDIIEKKPEEAIRRNPLSLGPAGKVGRSRDGNAGKTRKARQAPGKPDSTGKQEIWKTQTEPGAAGRPEPAEKGRQLPEVRGGPAQSPARRQGHLEPDNHDLHHLRQRRTRWPRRKPRRPPRRNPRRKHWMISTKKGPTGRSSSSGTNPAGNAERPGTT